MKTALGKYANSVSIDGEEIQLTFIGEGMTAICYKGNDYRIYKEFFPKQASGVCYYFRQSTGELEEAPGLTKEDKERLSIKYKKFQETKHAIESIYEAQAREDRTPLIAWEEKKSASGKVWFKSTFTGGNTLQEKYRELDKETNPILRLKQELRYIQYALDDLKVYHQVDYLNMDIKPENLWCVTLNDVNKVEGIRNLDFGSCVKVADIMKQGDVLMDLECTPQYYNYKFINQILNCSESDEVKRWYFKLLDVKATMKMLAKRVCGDYQENASRDYFLNNIYKQYFAMDAPCFEKYMLAYSLASLLSGNKLDRPFGGIDIEKNKFRLQELENIIDYILYGDKLDGACLTCHELKKFNYLLKDVNIYDVFKKDGRWLKPENCVEILSMREFSRELTPTIKFQGKEYYTDNELSIVSLFLRCIETGVKDLLLYGEGGMGKSRNLKALKRYLLKEEIPFYSRELKTVMEETISSFSKEIESLLPLKDKVVILDGYDELDASIKDKVDIIIRKHLTGKCRLFIIGSRISSTKSAGLVHIKKSLSSFFFNFEQAKLCPFTKDKILSLINKKSQAKEYLSLLQNTMFLCMQLELEKLDAGQGDTPKIQTEPDLIQQYFIAMFNEKGMTDFPSSRLYHLGEFIHQQRDEKGRFLEEIPEPLNNILLYYKNPYVRKKKLHQEYVLNAEQVKYLNYLHAFYIVHKLELIAVEEEEREILIKQIFDIPSTEMTAESFYYAGQLIRKHARKKNIFKILNEDGLKEKLLRYENVLCLFLGAYNGVAKDIKGVFTFYHPCMQSSYSSYLYACDYIKVLKANSIQNLQFLSYGTPRLKKIEINNDIYYSQGNCLITRLGNELHLGCNTSKIPSKVWYIHKHAFSRSGIRKIVIPDSITQIGSCAFLYCEELEHVVLGENLVLLPENAFYKCSAIKTLHIKNKAMEGKDKYSLKAFVRIPRLERVIIPTTAVEYIYRLLEEDKKQKYPSRLKRAGYRLKYLEIFQGERPSWGKELKQLVPLTFETIKGPNFFKELHLRRDMQEISKASLGRMINNFVKITVAKGCKRFMAKNNCLIDKQEKTLIMGCKKSIIPKGKVKRIGSYAFAWCMSMRKLYIPSGIESIGESTFLYCNKLKKIFLPKTLKTVGQNAFGMPDKCLKKQTSPYALQEVVIEDCTSWAQVIFPFRTSNPIYYAKHLTSADIKDGKMVLRKGINKIASVAFYNARNLTAVDIPSTITEIGGAAFFGCEIKTVNIHNLAAWGNVELGSFSANPCWRGANLFVDDKDAKYLVFKPNTTLKKFTFARISNIERIALYEGCVVGEQVFDTCPNLQEVIIYSSKISINPTAFRKCKVRIQFHGTEEEWKKMTCGNDLEGVISVSFNG